MSKYRIKVKNPLLALPLNYLDVHNPEQMQLLEQGKDLADAQLMSAEFLKLYFAQGNKGHFTTGMRSLYYVDEDGRAVIPFVRVIVKKVYKHE